MVTTIDPMFQNLQAVQESWTRTMTSMVWGQWLMLDMSLRAAETLLTSAAPGAPSTSPGQATSTVEAGAGDLINLAMERMKRGLAPPSRIYQTPYRNQIDWSKFPDWARPTDPDLFEGSSHEG